MLSGDIEPLTNLLKELGILEKIKLKLFNNPDQASRDLIDILDQINSGYEAIINALSKFTQISFDNEEKKKESEKFLFLASHGHLGARIESARACCSRINNVYERYLKGWFSRIGLSKDEKEELGYLFRKKF